MLSSVRKKDVPATPYSIILKGISKITPIGIIPYGVI
jgi:hypothetical protein